MTKLTNTPTHSIAHMLFTRDPNPKSWYLATHDNKRQCVLKIQDSGSLYESILTQYLNTALWLIQRICLMCLYENEG